MSAEVLSKARQSAVVCRPRLDDLADYANRVWKDKCACSRCNRSLLALLSVLIALYSGSLELFGVGVALVVVKGIMIPRVLNRAVAKIGLSRVAAPYLGTAPALMICGILTIIAFYVMTPIAASNPLPTADAIPLAFAGVLIGFFIMVNRRRAVTQILGFLMLENGIFLLALLATYGVPFIVEMGVFLDVLGRGADHGSLRLSHQG